MSSESERSHFAKGDRLQAGPNELYKICEKLGEGRCSIVYSAQDCNNRNYVAIKVYNSGSRYEGALQRELCVLETLRSLENKLAVHWYGQFEAFAHRCITLELLDLSMRQILYKNDKRGLGLWGVQKFARDVFSGLAILHSENLVHADLKPANIHWSVQYGCFKLIDFGLSFHLSEESIHQVQSSGYQAPEVQTWNQYKQLSRLTGSHKTTATCTSESVYKSCACLQHQQICHDFIESSAGCITQGENGSSHFIGSSQCKQTRRNSRQFIEHAEDRTRCCSCVPPSSPGKVIDVWSVGCLIMEITTGRKFLRDNCTMHQVTEDKYQSFMSNLIDDQLTDAFLRYESGLNVSASYEMLRDLVSRCCDCNPKTRLTTELALQHPFLQMHLDPKLSDCFLLPTSVLLVTNVAESRDLTERKFCTDIVTKVLAACRMYGPVQSCYMETSGPLKDSVLVQFTYGADCQKAMHNLSGTTLNDRSIVTAYFPLEMYKYDSSL